MKTKSKTRRLISFLLTVCMLLSLIPSFGMTAFASDTTVVSDVSFTLGFHKESRETRKLRDYLTTDYYYEDVKDIIYYMITENPPGCDDYYSISMISIKYKTRDGYYKNVEEEYSEMLSAYTQYYLCFIFKSERGKVFARNPTVNISDPLGMLPDGVLNNIEVAGIDEQNVVYIYVPLPVTGDGFEISYTTDLACHRYLTNNYPPYDIHAPHKFYTKLYPMGLVGTGTNGGTKEQEADVAFKTLSGERIPGGDGCDDCLYLYINNRGAAQLDANYTATLANTDDFRIIRGYDFYTIQDGVVTSTRPLEAGSYFRYYYTRIYPTVTTPGTYTTDVYIDATTEGRPLPRITLHCSVTILGAEDRVDIICYDDPDFNGMFTTDGDTTEICREYKNIMCNGNAERLFYLSDNATVPVAYYESNACIAWKDSSSGRFCYFNEGSLYASASFPPPANTKPQLYYSFRVYPAEGKVFSNNTKFYLNYREADEEDFIVNMDDSLHYATVLFKATTIIDRVYTSGLGFTKTSAKDMTSYEGTEFTPSFTSVINNSGTVKAYSYEWGCEQIGGTGESTIIVDKNTGASKIYPEFSGNCRVWMKQVIDYEVNYITYRFKSSEISRDYPVQRRGYDLRINSADAHVTRIPASGSETQLGVETYIYDIIYVPNDGYYFPEDYGQDIDGNGRLTFRRDNNTQMVVTGVLDGNTEITLPPAAAMSPQDAPEVIGGDMSIGWTTAKMQYRTGDSLWQSCDNISTTVSSAGIYEVRLKETDTKLAGAVAKVAVYDGSDTTSYSVDYDPNGGVYKIPPAYTITKTHKAGETFQLSANTYYYTGHRFVGWSDGVNVYKAKATYTMPSWPVTFVALWRSTTVVTNNSVSGTFKSFGDATEQITIQLTKQGSSETPREVKVTGNTGSYSISDVASGTYTMKVIKTKHCTREYTVTVGSTGITQNVEIWLYGDVTGDGIVNMTDAGQIKRKQNGISSIFGSSDAATEAYRLLVANVYAADGVVNTTDAMQIKRYFNGSSSVFDSIP